MELLPNDFLKMTTKLREINQMEIRDNFIQKYEKYCLIFNENKDVYRISLIDKIPVILENTEQVKLGFVKTKGKIPAKPINKKNLDAFSFFKKNFRDECLNFRKMKLSTENDIVNYIKNLISKLTNNNYELGKNSKLEETLKHLFNVQLSGKSYKLSSIDNVAIFLWNLDEMKNTRKSLKNKRKELTEEYLEKCKKHEKEMEKYFERPIQYDDVLLKYQNIDTKQICKLSRKLPTSNVKFEYLFKYLDYGDEEEEIYEDNDEKEESDENKNERDESDENKNEKEGKKKYKSNKKYSTRAENKNSDTCIKMDEIDENNLNGNRLGTFSMSELREICNKKGISMKGTKSMLIYRILNAKIADVKNMEIHINELLDIYSQSQTATNLFCSGNNYIKGIYIINVDGKSSIVNKYQDYSDAESSGDD